MPESEDSRDCPSHRLPPRGRDPRIDFWRGLCVVGMAAWHLMTNTLGSDLAPFPGWLSFPTIQAFNFVAEGFVLLAGLSVGLVVSRMPGDPLRVKHYLRRGLQLLLVHYAVVAIILLAFAPELPKWFTAQTTCGKILSIFTLQYQPYLGDILSVFVFLFLATPIFLALRRKCGDGVLLGTSAAFYLAANLLPWLAAQRVQWTMELNSGGAFDFNSWQLVFVAGIVLGGRCEQWMDRLRRSFWTWFVVASAAFVVVAGCRLAILKGPAVSPEAKDLLLGRHPLTPIRTVYIALEMLLIALVTIRAWPHLAELRVVRGVVVIGRHSLTVFVASVFLDYLLKAAMARWHVALPLSLIVLAVELGAMLAVALVLDGRCRARVATGQ